MGLVLLTAVAVAALLAAESLRYRPLVWVAKPLASTAFVGVALAAGATQSAYGVWVLAALGLCWLGDVLLIPRGAGGLFRMGLGSFLLGHLAYGAAFGVRGLDEVVLAVAAPVSLVPALLAVRWLRPHVPSGMRVAVYSYVAVISGMVVCAAATVGASGDLRILGGTLMFYVSDLAVARERFVTSSPRNAVWGLPL